MQRSRRCCRERKKKKKKGGGKAVGAEWPAIDIKAPEEMQDVVMAAEEQFKACVALEAGMEQYPQIEARHFLAAVCGVSTAAAKLRRITRNVQAKLDRRMQRAHRKMRRLAEVRHAVRSLHERLDDPSDTD